MVHFSCTAYAQMAQHGYSMGESVTKAAQLAARHRQRMAACSGASHAVLVPAQVSPLLAAGRLPGVKPRVEVLLSWVLAAQGWQVPPGCILTQQLDDEMSTSALCNGSLRA